MSSFIQFLGLILVVVLSSYVLARACDSFEGAADFLGRKLPPGVKGATINAVGSSLPELFTTLALLFVVGGEGVFAAGIAVTAGSAVFNSDLIPTLCILAVMVPATFRLVMRILTAGIYRMRTDWKTVDSITIDKPALIRDGLALLVAETFLIILLGQDTLTWKDGLLLMLIYVPYVFYMTYQSQGHDAGDDEVAEEDDNENENEEAVAGGGGALAAVLAFDFNQLYFKGQAYTDERKSQAWIVLASSIAVISVACYALGEAIVGSAELLGVHAMVTALFLGAAASSVPDTILSVKDAIKGNYNDAISNAVGSNTFDICVALGLPLFLYTIVNGSVTMPNHEAVMGLRIALIVITAVILSIFLLPRKVKLWQAKVLASLYLVWTIYILTTA